MNISKQGSFVADFFKSNTSHNNFHCFDCHDKTTTLFVLPDLAALDFEIFFLSSQIPKSIYFCPFCLFIPLCFFIFLILMSNVLFSA